MVCSSKDCFWFKKHGDCFYDGLMPSNHPKTPEECEFFKTPTNYDLHIRKTPEELAKWIVEIADCDKCKEMHGFRMCDAALDKACEDCWAGWLRQEAE